MALATVHVAFPIPDPRAMQSNDYCLKHCQDGMPIGGGNFEMATATFTSPRNEELMEFANVLSHRYPKRMKAFDGFLSNEAQSKY
jgi:hypothetical protein